VLLAFAAIVLSTPAAWIQCVRVYRTKRTDGLSLATLVLCLWHTSAWAIYGVANGDVLLIASNIIVLIAWVTLFSLIRMRAGLPVRTLLVRVALPVAVAADVALYFGAQGCGVLATMFCAVTQLPQLKKAIRFREGTDGISVVALTVTVASCAVWVAHGQRTSDAFLIGTSVWAGGQAFFVLLRVTQIRARRAFAARPSFAAA
jgi:uncharacterized protein with PQ loop repeat